jgi:pilus assembly protein Flp/PilA
MFVKKFDVFVECPRGGPGIEDCKSRRPIMKFINKLIRDEAGATAIEYGLIAALIAVAAISAMSGLGSQLSSTFNTTSEEMQKGIDAGKTT